MADQQDIIVVSGLPRSGTSMMMQMLEAGGIPAMTDRIRKADADNPKGYYEFEKVKRIKHDNSWMEECPGKAVKMISALLYDLPPRNRYKIVFMKRDVREVIASQNAMLERLGREKAIPSDEEMAERSLGHLERLERWLATQSNMQLLYLHYRDVIEQPRESARLLSTFAGIPLNVEKMAGAVEKSLYRQRSAKE